MADLIDTTFTEVRKILRWKQEYFGMLFGMGKQAISRFETGGRKETIAHKEMLSLVKFLDDRNLINEYVRWRFEVNVSRRFYKKGTPMDKLKYIENK
jgi:transcriptional regulator with XRE-family HTH domain